MIAKPIHSRKQPCTYDNVHTHTPQNESVCGHCRCCNAVRLPHTPTTNTHTQSHTRTHKQSREIAHPHTHKHTRTHCEKNVSQWGSVIKTPPTPSTRDTINDQDCSHNRINSACEPQTQTTHENVAESTYTQSYETHTHKHSRAYTHTGASRSSRSSTDLCTYTNASQAPVNTHPQIHSYTHTYTHKQSFDFIKIILINIEVPLDAISSTFHFTLGTPDLASLHDSKKLQRFKGSALLDGLSNLLTVFDECTYTHTPADRQISTNFDAVKVPSISIHSYYSRLVEFFHCSPTCHLLALIYIDRIARKHPQGFPVDTLNFHRLFVTALTIAAKFYDDKFLSNTYYGQVGGVATKEINRLEVRMLSLLNYDVVVSPLEFEDSANILLRYAHAVTQWRKRQNNY